MNWKSFALQFAGLIVIAIAMFPLFGLTMNLLLLFHLIPAESIDKGIGVPITHKAMFVWVGSLLLGFVSLFIREQWRLALYFSPLYAPPLFAIIYTLAQ